MEFLDTLARHPALFIGCCGVLGLLIGSFLNVVIHRLPIMMDNELRAECAALAGTDDFTPPTFNLVVPRSACPACKAPITALQNIPVVSWLALRGKCANCKTRISARYPLVELATGVLSAFIAWRFGFGANAVAALAFTWLLISLTMIDFDTQLLPDALTYPLLWLGLIYSLWHPAWAPGAAAVGPRDSIIGAVAGYLSLWSVYWAFKLITGKEGMGYGDFKLFAALGRLARLVDAAADHHSRLGRRRRGRRRAHGPQAHGEGHAHGIRAVPRDRGLARARRRTRRWSRAISRCSPHRSSNRRCRGASESD